MASKNKSVILQCVHCGWDCDTDFINKCSVALINPRTACVTWACPLCDDYTVEHNNLETPYRKNTDALVDKFSNYDIMITHKWFKSRL